MISENGKSFQGDFDTIRYLYLNHLVNEFVERCKLGGGKLAPIKAIQFAPCSLSEGENIDGLLEGFLNQSLPKTERLLVIFVNGRKGNEDTVTSRLEKYAQDNENIIVLRHIWLQNEVFSMGLIRAIPVEFIKRLYLKYDVTTNPLIISNDADTVDLSVTYLDNLLSKLGENEFGGSVSRYQLSRINFLYDLNIVLGDIDRAIRSFHLERGEDSFDRNYIYPGGSNTAFRLRDYPGYDIGRNQGEDTSLCINLELAEVAFRYVHSAKVYTNPRRVLNTFNNGGFFHESWQAWEGDGKEGREEMILRSAEFTLEEVISFLNSYFANRLKYLFSKNYHKGNLDLFGIYADNYVRKMLKYLKVFLNGGDIQIPTYEYISLADVVRDYVGEDFVEYLLSHKFIKVNEV